MTADEFWRDLAARFRALHDEQLRERSNDVLHGNWSSIGAEPDNGSPWSLSGGSARIRTQFEWLAQSAAVRLGHPGGPAAVFAWLDRLKAESPRYKGGILGSWSEPRVSKEIRTESGLIELLCLASAEYCLKCEIDERTTTRNAVPEVEATFTKTPQTSGASHDDDLAASAPVERNAAHFVHGPHYRQVEIGNNRFSLTPEQGRVIEILHEAYKKGRPIVPKEVILEKLERETSRLRDIFRSRPGAFKALIKRASPGRGIYRLNLPDPPKP